MKRILFALSIISLFLAACATPAGPVVVEVTSTSVPPTVEPTHIPVDLPPAQRAALAALAAQLGIPVDQITLVSSEAVAWPDGCLGVVRMGVLCIQGPIQGFRITLQAKGATYEYHTNQDGSVLVDATGKPTQPPAGTPTSEPTGAPSGEPTSEPTHIPVDIPPVQQKAIDAAIAALGLPADQVTLVSIEPVTWPDGCLGVVHMGMLCTQGQVPGFRIVLGANSKQYEFHTNLDASAVAPANGPAVEVPEAIVAVVKPMLAKALGVADSDIQVVSTQIIEWPDSCLGVQTAGVACSQVVTPGYIVTLQAKGQQYEYHTNGDASVVAPASLALSWQRLGGIAGFQDNLMVYSSGEIHAEWAAGSQDSTLAALTADQQAQLQDWLTRFGTVSVEHADPANASDQMSTSLTLLGAGSSQPSAAEQQAMVDWAQNVLSGFEK
jgi:hypothetical protein